MRNYILAWRVPCSIRTGRFIKSVNKTFKTRQKAKAEKLNIISHNIFIKTIERDVSRQITEYISKSCHLATFLKVSMYKSDRMCNYLVWILPPFFRSPDVLVIDQSGSKVKISWINKAADWLDWFLTLSDTFIFLQNPEIVRKVGNLCSQFKEIKVTFLKIKLFLCLFQSQLLMQKSELGKFRYLLGRFLSWRRILFQNVFSKCILLKSWLWWYYFSTLVQLFSQSYIIILENHLIKENFLPF